MSSILCPAARAPMPPRMELQYMLARDVLNRTSPAILPAPEVQSYHPASRWDAYFGGGGSYK
eukprot:1156961-Pelagomonas_calceolata.AAC.3